MGKGSINIKILLLGTSDYMAYVFVNDIRGDVQADDATVLVDATTKKGVFAGGADTATISIMYHEH